MQDKPRQQSETKKKLEFKANNDLNGVRGMKRKKQRKLQLPTTQSIQEWNFHHKIKRKRRVQINPDTLTLPSHSPREYVSFCY